MEKREWQSMEGKHVILGKVGGGYESRSGFTIKLMKPKHGRPPAQTPSRAHKEP